MFDRLLVEHLKLRHGMLKKKNKNIKLYILVPTTAHIYYLKYLRR